MKKADELKQLVEREKFVQYVFFCQLRTLKIHCQKMNVRIVGDLPFYVSLDSADVWAHPELFKLSKSLKPKYVGGVPPDYFSRTGQLWGTPVYDWRSLQGEQFDWWIRRIEHNLKFCDLLRLDHFRGFVAYWQVSSHAKTAKAGIWIRAPSKHFLGTMQRHFPTLPFIAEDLGAITKPVNRAITQLGIPGMRVLLFAFDGSKNNPHLPENYPENCVAYTGTHDTNTVKGWFLKEPSAEIKQRLFRYIGREVSEQDVSLEFVKLTFASKAKLGIIPLQDVLGLGHEARMNSPARQAGNWQWRVLKKQLTGEHLEKLRNLTVNSGR